MSLFNSKKSADKLGHIEFPENFIKAFFFKKNSYKINLL